jgi:SAM-dependent methyltransferase
MSVIWHDLECGAYTADVPLWRALGAEFGDPVLDVGAGTGRITLDLAQGGHRVTALDHDATLLGELAHRAVGLNVSTVHADARKFDLEETFALIIVPMQTIQLLGGTSGRRDFLARAARHLRPHGGLAIAITESVEHFSLEEGLPLPVPDMRELGGVVYSSQPTAVREGSDGFILERLREAISPAGERTTEHDVVCVDRLTVHELEREARACGLEPTGTRTIDATGDHVGSQVVIFRG